MEQTEIPVKKDFFADYSILSLLNWPNSNLLFILDLCLFYTQPRIV